MMTTKEMLTAVINANISDDVTAKAKAMLESAEKKNTKRTEEQSENRKANIETARVLASYMKTGVTYAASEIKVLVADELPDITTAKITAVAKVGIEEGILTAIDGYKVGGKGRAVKGYSAVAIEETTDEAETVDEATDETADE